MMQQKPQEKQQMKTLKQIVKESDFANPKSPGDKAFVDKHVIQKTDYSHKPKDGSNDDIFSGKKQKRKKKRTDHEPDDKAVYEMSDAKMKRKEEIVKGMKEEILEATQMYMAQNAPKAAMAMTGALFDPTELGIRDKMSAAKELLDRVGLVKTEKMQVEASGGVMLMPPKAPVEDDE